MSPENLAVMLTTCKENCCQPKKTISYHVIESDTLTLVWLFHITETWITWQQQPRQQLYSFTYALVILCLITKLPVFTGLIRPLICKNSFIVKFSKDVLTLFWFLCKHILRCCIYLVSICNKENISAYTVRINDFITLALHYRNIMSYSMITTINTTCYS